MPTQDGKLLIDAVNDLSKTVREMIAASKLLRSKIESAEEVQRVMQNKHARLETEHAELNRRLTAMENQSKIRNRT